jgi:hypothetical protein
MLQSELAPSISRFSIALHADKMYNSQRPDRGLFHVKYRLQTDTQEIENLQTCAFRELQSNILSKPEIENSQTCAFKELQCNILSKPEIENSQTCTFKELQCNILSKPEIENFSNLHLQGTAMQHPDQN